jgi:hypothetical protein
LGVKVFLHRILWKPGVPGGKTRGFIGVWNKREFCGNEKFSWRAVAGREAPENFEQRRTGYDFPRLQRVGMSR